MNKYLAVFSLTMGALTLQACGEKKATAVLKFDTATQTVNNVSTLATAGTPTKFKMKLIAAYLAEDIDPTTQSNVGSTQMIYLNEDCNDDISHCDISAGTAEDGSPMAQIISTFFDFSSPTTANTEVNAQAREVDPGSYKYVRLEFCKYNAASANNILWAGTGTGDVEFRRNSCTFNSSEMNPALEITAGESVSVDLGYSLTNLLSIGSDATGDSCTGSGASKTCFTMPTFVPTAN